jgi:hypothetical protein
MTGSRRLQQSSAIAALACILFGVGDAFAAPQKIAPMTPCDEPAKSDPGGGERRESCPSTLESSLTFASAYVYRGYNVFQAQRQDEQNWVARPRIIWTDSGERLSIGYTAVYQLNGDNLWENVAAGVGSDQIVFADYDFTPLPRIVVSPELGIYLYPQARDMPLLVEASAEGWYLGPVEVGLFAGYLAAIRPGPLSENYFYLSPRISKSLRLTRRMEFELGLTAGVKLFRQSTDSNANTFDVLVTEILRYDLSDVLYVSAKMAMAWTNLEPREDPSTGRTFEPGFIDELAPFWGFTFGVEL